MTGTGLLLVRGGTLVTMTRRGLAFPGDVLVEDGRIAAVGTSIEVPAGTERLDARGCLVLPGFVQAHVHVVQSLARHRAEGLPLLRWLTERIWPYEAALAPAETSAAARLGIAELLTGGTTTALDMGSAHHHDEVFTAAEALGIRLVSGKCLMDEGEGAPAGLRLGEELAAVPLARLPWVWVEGEEGFRSGFHPRYGPDPGQPSRAGASAHQSH